MRERRPKKALPRSIRLARAMRRGFAESNWQIATTPSSNACSKTVSGLAGHAGRRLRIMECNARPVKAPHSPAIDRPMSLVVIEPVAR
jgi:hypothetical protein